RLLSRDAGRRHHHLAGAGRHLVPSGYARQRGIRRRSGDRLHYMTYTLFGTGSGIKLTRSYDGGDTWATPVTVYNGGSFQGSFPAIDNAGRLFVAYQASPNMKVSRSLDGGDTFQEVASFATPTTGVTYMDRSSQFPQLAIDTSGGAFDGFVYVVWHSVTSGNLRPFITHSEDAGATWTTPIPMNSDDVVTYHWWPSVSVDALGNVN